MRGKEINVHIATKHAPLELFQGTSVLLMIRKYFNVQSVTKILDQNMVCPRTSMKSTKWSQLSTNVRYVAKETFSVLRQESHTR